MYFRTAWLAAGSFNRWPLMLSSLAVLSGKSAQKHVPEIIYQMNQRNCGKWRRIFVHRPRGLSRGSSYPMTFEPAWVRPS